MTVPAESHDDVFCIEPGDVEFWKNDYYHGSKWKTFLVLAIEWTGAYTAVITWLCPTKTGVNVTVAHTNMLKNSWTDSDSSFIFKAKNDESLTHRS